MAEASKHKLSYVVETTRGETPTNPRFQLLPDTRTTLAAQKDTLTSERLSPDRFQAPPRTGATTASGDIPNQLSFGTYDDFIASALQGDWVDAAGVGVDSVDIDIDGTPTSGITAGDTYATSNGVVTFERVDSLGEEVDAVYTATAGGATTNHRFNGLETITIDGEDFEVTAYNDAVQDATVKGGDTRKSFSILREFSDMGAVEKFLLFKGCEVASWNLTATANGVAASTFSLFGRYAEAIALAAPTGTTYKDPIESEEFDTFSGNMKIDGVKKCIVTEYNLTVNNNLAPKFTVGCEGSQDPSVGQLVVEGSITVFFETPDLYKKFFEDTEFALELTLQDTDGKQLIVDLPHLRAVSGTQPDVSGDGPITLPISFTGHKDDTAGTSVSVRRVAPLAV